MDIKMLRHKTLLGQLNNAHFFSTGITTFQAQITTKDILNYNGTESDKDFIPLHQYFLKFSYFNVKLPPIANLHPSHHDFYPINNIKCEWKYTNNLQSLFSCLSMPEYELTTAKSLVKYFGNFPFNYYDENSLSMDDQKLIDLIQQSSNTAFNFDTFNTMYTNLYEAKCSELYGNDMNNININLPLAQNVIKDFVFNFNVQVNGHLIKRNNLSLRTNDTLQIDIPSSEILLNCQRRLLQYLFKLNGLTKKERGKQKYKLYQIYNKKQQNQAIITNLFEKLCLQRFNDNIVHSIRHCITPDDCGYNKSDIILYEDDVIIICNKPSGMACHFAPDTQKYHNDSLMNFLLYYCPDLQRNIQKDSTVLKSGIIAHSDILPSKVTELQLTISPGIVHRIDKQSSGIIVIGKTIHSMSNLFKQWEYHQNIEREYIVLCHGKFDGDELRDKFIENEYENTQDEYYRVIKKKYDKKHKEIDAENSRNHYKCECWIGPKLIKKRAVGPLKCYNSQEYEQRKNQYYDKNVDDLKKVLKMSCTYFYKLKEYKVDDHVFTLLKCRLITGRTHQIRLHAQYIGMSVVGDRTYPRIKNWNIKYQESKKVRPDKDDETYMTTDVDIEMQMLGLEWRNYDCHALHAQSLKFLHPDTGKEMIVTAELPPFFKDLLNNIENYSDLSIKKL